MNTKLPQAIIPLAIIGLAVMLMALPANSQEAAKSDKAANPILPAEQPFHDSAQAFVDAYASRDAEAIGELFTSDAEFLDEFGERTDGRVAIVEMFQDVFDSTPEAQIEEIKIERIRHITETVVLEEGVVVSREAADSLPYQSRYVALHTKGTDGIWRINTLKDTPRENTNRREQLQQLAWLTGEWVNEDLDSVVHSKCDWSDDGNYLLKEFTVQTFDGRVMNGVQRIGWDAARRKLRSWTFDSEGGFFTGLWTKNNDEWLVTSVGVTAEGKTVTGTAIYTRVDDEMITWQYRNLIVGGDVRSMPEPVTMVKRPPPAQGSK